MESQYGSHTVILEPMAVGKASSFSRSSCSEAKSSEVPFPCTSLSLRVMRRPQTTRDAPSVTPTDGASIKLTHLQYAPSRRKGTSSCFSLFNRRAVLELHIGM